MLIDACIHWIESRSAPWKTVPPRVPVLLGAVIAANLGASSCRPLQNDQDRRSQSTTMRADAPAPNTSDCAEKLETIGSRDAGCDIGFDPPEIDLGIMQPDEHRTFELRLTNNTQTEITQIRLYWSGLGQGHSAILTPVPPGTQARATVEFVAPPVDDRDIDAYLVARPWPGHACNCRLRAHVLAAISLTPRRISHPASNVGTTVLRLRSTDERPFRVLGCYPPLQTEVLPTPSVTSYEIVLNWAKWEETWWPGKVVLWTDHPRSPVVTLHVYPP